MNAAPELPPWLQPPLQQALARQRGHALLVQGAEGIGIWPFLQALARAWLCETEGEHRPCGHCAACRLLAGGTHPDLRLLLPEALRANHGLDPGGDGDDGPRQKKKPSRQIRIDEVRAAVDWLVQSSSRGRAKVLVLHPAEAMNLQAASALLKTLEEPPGQGRWLLGTADAARLLPTVRSRCQLIRLPPPAATVGARWLEGQGVGEAAALLAAAGGQPLEAVAMAAAGIDAAIWSAVPKAVAAGQASVFAGWPLSRVLDALHKLCHDAAALAAGGEPRFFPRAALPPGGVPEKLMAWADTLRRVARHAEHPWNEGLLVEALVAEGCSSWQPDAAPGSALRPALATLGR
ncbi:MAG: DNA polymerase III subunit delta' [Burkholderiales bacterium]|nr:DNA polymerase III subunit delta' [Burkholderiales bacterium]